jgi:hypothetical protein
MTLNMALPPFQPDGLVEIHPELEVEMGDMPAAIADRAAVAQRVDSGATLEHEAALRRCAAGAVPVAAQRVFGEIGRRFFVGQRRHCGGETRQGDDGEALHGSFLIQSVG